MGTKAEIVETHHLRLETPTELDPELAWPSGSTMDPAVQPTTPTEPDDIITAEPSALELVPTSRPTSHTKTLSSHEWPFAHAPIVDLKDVKIRRSTPRSTPGRTREARQAGRIPRQAKPAPTIGPSRVECSICLEILPPQSFLIYPDLNERRVPPDCYKHLSPYGKLLSGVCIDIASDGNHAVGAEPVCKSCLSRGCVRRTVGAKKDGPLALKTLEVGLTWNVLSVRGGSALGVVCRGIWV
ncbi:hypothetical protein N0V90_003394 [Kalmusia sp. IMI 367209]|nr:hypothetical protein N0V90_003394 [Kalmusia sp. IMI 367209]